MEFVHGVAHLGRAAAAEKLRLADAVSAPHMKKGDLRQWQRDLRATAGI